MWLPLEHVRGGSPWTSSKSKAAPRMDLVQCSFAVATLQIRIPIKSDFFFATGGGLDY
jgi:hypothetical protein